MLDRTRATYGFAALTALLLLVGGCSTSPEVAKQCVQADLIDQCPVGSNPELGARAEDACGGSVGLDLVGQSGSITGQCSGTGECRVLCQFDTPCTCGVETITKEQIVCSKCPNQSCGDGRCEGSERLECAPGAPANCQACAEDCGGATCGDGDCTGTEDPQSCPQDCAATCVPNQGVCAGNKLLLCSADGSSQTETDCAAGGLICAAGTCQTPNVCGNGLCEAPGETVGSCPADCANLCVPSSVKCLGETLETCAADGQSKSQKACTDDNLICVNGACVTPKVCSNGRCEMGETEANCPADCTAPECGDGTCDTGEQTTCPQDCTVCGNGSCEAGEMTSCPQDCGVCDPGSRTCVGPLLTVCAANGASQDTVDCSQWDLTCGKGECVPPLECGNGLCEAGELGSCAVDCTEICGNDVCGPGETFESCSADCDPVCGDGSCDAGEAGSCSADCIATCGNGTCDGGEDRSNCHLDCGFCGDGVCQDGFETPLAQPPAGSALESCAPDCVTINCSEDSDCDDGVDCTANTCDTATGVCQYTPDDGLCGDKESCLAKIGCCIDFDGDGFTASSCGGSDCDDGEFDIRPGAIEICGGGDTNCSDTHAPAIGTIIQLTSDPNDKAMFTIARGANDVMLAWMGKPLGEWAAGYARASVGGQLLGEVEAVSGVIPPIPANGGETGVDVALAYSSETGGYGLSWARYYATTGGFNYGQAFFNRVETDDSLAFANNIVLIDDQATLLGYGAGDITTHGLAWYDGTYYFGQTGPPAGNSTPNLIGMVSEAGGLTSAAVGCPTGAVHEVFASDTGFGCVSEAGIVTFTAAGEAVGSVAASASLYSGEIAMTWTGGLLASARSDGSTLLFEGLNLGGQAAWSEVAAAVAMRPLDVYQVAGTDDVAILATDGSNLYFMVRDAATGEERLAYGLIGAGTEVDRGAVVWTGLEYGAYFTAKVGAVRQVFYAPIKCK